MTTRTYPEIINESVEELAKWVREVTRIRSEDIGDADASKNTVESITLESLSSSDVTTNNVTSSKHGFAPKSPADATKFLNGAATPDYAQVKDSDLVFTDITTNDASTTKHGFLKKLSNVVTQFMNGKGNWIDLGFSSSFTSSGQSITNGTKTTVAHGLGAVPMEIFVYLVNTTTEGNYAVGDILPMSAWSEAGTPRGIAISADATNIYLTVSASGINTLNKNTGAFLTITNGNWNMIGVARK